MTGAIILIGGWDSTLFWWDPNCGSRGRIDEATLPISADLKRQLDDWYRTYSELYHGDGEGPVPVLEERLLDDKGLEIWKRLREELDGVYEVLFFSHQFSCPFASPEHFDLERRKTYA
jgi:hypothetical protein